LKILCISDHPEPILYDYYTPGRFDDIDLVISCGDLNASYLSFIVTMLNVPLLYVRGNHDLEFETSPPGGCEDIHGRIVEVNGVRILGLEGSIRYTRKAVQYSEWQMKCLIWRLKPGLWWKRGVDIVVTHAPPLGINDAEDRCHQGFRIYNKLIKLYRPRYFLHGHVHLNYSRRRQRISTVNSTHVINCDGYYMLDYEKGPKPGLHWH